jgi:hypothetical protein
MLQSENWRKRRVGRDDGIACQNCGRKDPLVNAFALTCAQIGLRLPIFHLL